MSDARDRLQRLYENLLEVTDETAHQPVDVELALNLCRQLSSGRAALISDLDAQVATLTTERDDARATLAKVREWATDLTGDCVQTDAFERIFNILDATFR